MRRLVCVKSMASSIGARCKLLRQHSNRAHPTTSALYSSCTDETRGVWSENVRTDETYGGHPSSLTQRVNYAAQIDNYLRDLHQHNTQLREAIKSQSTQRDNKTINMSVMQVSSSPVSTLMFTIIRSMLILFVLWTFVDDVCNIYTTRQAHKYIRKHCETTYNVKWKEI